MNDIENEDRRVCESLRGLGLEVNSVYDLVNNRIDYSEAISVLLDWLPRCKSDRVKEGVARALTVKEAGVLVARGLIREFERYLADSPSKEVVKWAIGNAISETATSELLEELVSLAIDRRHGKAREMLVIAVGKNGNSDRDVALKTLLTLLDDPIVQGHAIIGLRYLNDERSRASLERFVNHETAWVRKEAQRALTRLRSN